MQKIRSILVMFVVIFVFFSLYASAHSGKTDSNGGHYNHSTGDYHYHHGYPAHEHIDGICPYATSSKAQSSSDSETSDVCKFFGCVFGSLFIGFLLGCIPTSVIMVLFIALTMNNKEAYDKYSDKLFHICTAVFTAIGVVVVFIGLWNDLY